ncbi:MAG: hypothetical protein O3C10_12175 [Chloroflexi bacterium]|nr:hypothetical protein [Chloroflexota bacterium]
MPERRCGECGECCKVLAVKEIGKPSDVPCPHLVDGQAGGCCGIYDAQPSTCRAFKCGWLIGNFRDDYRPDRIGIVVYQVNSEVGRGICLAESRPGTLDSEAAREIADEVRAVGMLVIKREAHPEMPGE